MRRVLFLMHEGVGATIFQSQVAIHALEMRKEDVQVEIWSYETAPWAMGSSRRNLRALRDLGELRVRVLRGVFVFLPLSVWLNAALLWLRLRRQRHRFDLVHARADYSASVYALVGASIGLPMVWDCRGDSYAETSDVLARRKGVMSLSRKWILGAVERQERRAGAGCSAANFVSRLLRDRKGHSLHGQPAFVIPCLVSSRYFHFDRGLRAERRAELGFAPEDVVLVYSGAMTSYQSFGAYADLVAEMVGAGDTSVRLLILTPDEERAREHVAGRLPERTYLVRSAPYATMNGYLNAADFGMLLRERSPINDVASPTKFGEYCLAGLPVILDGHVSQTMEVSAAIGNGVAYADIKAGRCLTPRDVEVRERIAEMARGHYARECLNGEYRRLYDAAVAGSDAPERDR